MTIRLEQDSIRLSGTCPVEEAESLLALLQENALPVDLTDCVSLHLAVVQVLLAARPKICGAPADRFVRDNLLPLLQG